MHLEDFANASDNELVKLSQKGIARAFEELVKRHYQFMFRLCYWMVNDVHKAEDLTQEIFIKVYKSIKNFRLDSKFSTYLYRTAINCCLNELRKKQEQPINTEIKIKDTVNPTSIEIVGKREEAIAVKKCLNQLPDEQRIVVVLYIYEDEITFSRIAEILRISEGTVKTRYYNAIPKLKFCLESKGVGL